MVLCALKYAWFFVSFNGECRFEKCDIGRAKALSLRTKISGKRSIDRKRERKWSAVTAAHSGPANSKVFSGQQQNWELRFKWKTDSSRCYPAQEPFILTTQRMLYDPSATTATLHHAPSAPMTMTAVISLITPSLTRGGLGPKWGPDRTRYVLT